MFVSLIFITAASPPPHATANFHVTESRRYFYFLQQENLLRAEVVIRATNNRNLQSNIVARQVARKCCPYYLALKKNCGITPNENISAQTICTWASNVARKFHQGAIRSCNDEILQLSTFPNMVILFWGTHLNTPHYKLNLLSMHLLMEPCIKILIWQHQLILDRPFPSCYEPYYESEAKCKTFHMFCLPCLYCWFACDVMAAILVYRNNKIFLLWDLNSIFMQTIWTNFLLFCTPTWRQCKPPIVRFKATQKMTYSRVLYYKLFLYPFSC